MIGRALARAWPAALALLALVLAAGLAAAGVRPSFQDRFDHERHADLFPTCTSCHAGIVAAGEPVYPPPQACAACHDGEVEERIEWRGPARTATNLDFTHPRHRDAVAAHTGSRDTALDCAACHNQAGAEDRMQVRLAVTDQCLACHGVRTAHLAAPDTACATCHVPLVRAAGLTRERVADFPAPPSHEQADFAMEGHGRYAEAARPEYVVAPSCATCHAQDFCLTCHVDAPERRTIQALGRDPRSTAIEAALEAPPSHREPDFEATHGDLARRAPQRCVTCHTQESCLVCHTAPGPQPVRALHAAAPGRGRGAVIETVRRPASHGADFTNTHGPVAAARSTACTTCHTQESCLDCHRPAAASARDYHPAGFLARHPAAAYNRETTCTDCHNTAAFCADCHQQAGLSAQGALRAGFHDAKRSFILGHGQAARQNLENCVACHTEQDCLTCHSAQTRRFNPHGPGFDADRLRGRNPEMCSVCHGRAIPGT